MESFQEVKENRTNELEKFEIAKNDTSTYRNCAGFTRYMLGLDIKETLASPETLANELNPISFLPLNTEFPENLEEEIYIENAKSADAVAIRVNITKNDNPKNLSEIVNNTKSGEKYIHFAYIDPSNKKMIFQRPDLELKPEHTEWRGVLNDLEEFNGMEKRLVFFKK
jgi:hypothetical protein